MGYRSDVVLAIAPEAASAFMALCAKYPKVLELCHEADEFKSGYEQEGDYFMYWADIKWSDSGEADAPRNEDGNGTTQWHEYFKFIRIGGDQEDTESLGWGFPDIFMARSINF